MIGFSRLVIAAFTTVIALSGNPSSKLRTVHGRDRDALSLVALGGMLLPVCARIYEFGSHRIARGQADRAASNFRHDRNAHYGSSAERRSAIVTISVIGSSGDSSRPKRR